MLMSMCCRSLDIEVHPFASSSSCADACSSASVSVVADAVAVAICFVCVCCRGCPGQAMLRCHIKILVALLV